MPQPLAVILRAGGLGDTVLALPAIASVRASLPGWRIRLVGYPSSIQIARPLVDEIVSVDSSRSGWFDGADLVIAWSQNRPVVPGRLIHASPYPPPGVHASDWLLESLPLDLRRGVEDAFAHLSQFLGTHDPPTDSQPNESRPVVIHPGAGADWKRWPARDFALLSLLLLERGIPVAVLAGPADETALSGFQKALHEFTETEGQTTSQVSRLMSEVSPPTSHVASLMSHLSRARAFVGNDSGVTHLAAALGIPTVALFGPTEPANWSPRGARVVRVCASTSQQQGQVRVCYDPRCMEAISVDTALDVLLAILVGEGQTCLE